MKENSTKPSDNSENPEEMETEEEIDPQEELVALNTQIDQLNSILDVLEKKNDDIHAQLVEILKSTREARGENQEPPQEKPSAS